MLAIVSCFAARLYGGRSQQFRHKVKAVARQPSLLAEKSIPATRTVRLRIAPSTHQGKLTALEATVADPGK